MRHTKKKLISKPIDYYLNYIVHTDAVHTYTLEEKIINLCDLMCTKDGIFTIDKRMVDLISRKGAYETTQYHVIETVKLKKYFDDLLGYNLYNLFPEIKENL